MPAEFSINSNKALTWLVTVVFALFLLMLPRYNDIAKVWFVILIFAASLYMMLNLKEMKATSNVKRAFFAAIITNFLWITFTFYINGEPGRGASFLWGRHFYLLFVIPLFFLFRKFAISDRAIVLTLSLSILLSLVDILIDISQGIDHRLQGMNPNAFGPIQLCLSGVLFFYFISERKHWLRWLGLVGFILGIATVIFSKSRNTWLTLVVLSIFFIYYLSRSQPVWKRVGLVIGIVLLLASSYLLPVVERRVDYAFESLTDYFASDDYQSVSRARGLGVRIELWKAAWNIFIENPVLGVGVGGFKVEVRKNSERYQVNKITHRFKYAHNQYLVALATRGFPGLIFFLLVMLIPVYIAMSQKSSELESRLARLSIILICLNYLVGSLGEDHFEAKSATMFFGIMLPFLLAKVSTGKSRDNPAYKT